MSLPPRRRPFSSPAPGTVLELYLPAGRERSASQERPRDFVAHLLKRRVGSCGMKFFDDFCDGVANSRDFTQSILGDRSIAKLAQRDETARRLMSSPGFGPITASAMAATIQDTSSFAGPREFAAFLGLVPSRFMLELTGASSGDMRLSDHAARSMI